MELTGAALDAVVGVVRVGEEAGFTARAVAVVVARGAVRWTARAGSTCRPLAARTSETVAVGEVLIVRLMTLDAGAIDQAVSEVFAGAVAGVAPVGASVARRTVAAAGPRARAAVGGAVAASLWRTVYPEDPVARAVGAGQVRRRVVQVWWAAQALARGRGAGQTVRGAAGRLAVDAARGVACFVARPAVVVVVQIVRPCAAGAVAHRAVAAAGDARRADEVVCVERPGARASRHAAADVGVVGLQLPVDAVRTGPAHVVELARARQAARMASATPADGHVFLERAVGAPTHATERALVEVPVCIALLAVHTARAQAAARQAGGADLAFLVAIESVVDIADGERVGLGERELGARVVDLRAEISVCQETELTAEWAAGGREQRVAARAGGQVAPGCLEQAARDPAAELVAPALPALARGGPLARLAPRVAPMTLAAMIEMSDGDPIVILIARLTGHMVVPAHEAWSETLGAMAGVGLEQRVRSARTLFHAAPHADAAA